MSEYSIRCTEREVDALIDLICRNPQRRLFETGRTFTVTLVDAADAGALSGEDMSQISALLRDGWRVTQTNPIVLSKPAVSQWPQEDQ